MLRLIAAERCFYVKYLEVPLFRREFDILYCLLQHPESILSREQLMDFVGLDEESSDRNIDPHISRLRGKLRAAQASQVDIAAIYGVGYVLRRAC